MNKGQSIMDVMQRFSKAMFIPVLILPIAGLLIAIGNIFTNPNLLEAVPFLDNPYTVGFGTIISGSLVTIYRELKRCPSDQYQAQDTHEGANQRARLKGRNPKYTVELLKDIQDKLERTWSPEQIVGRDYQGKFPLNPSITGFTKIS